MYQHPIPQNVTSYQFRLVGDLTLKQFLEFLIGVGLAVLFYFSNLYSPLKAVLMGASVVFGIALAFIPIEERPLDQWVIAFFRAIYRPTQFVWHKQPVIPEYFLYQASATAQSVIEDSDTSTQRKQAGLFSYMQTLPVDDFYNTLDTQQTEQLKYISRLFSNDTPLSTLSVSKPPEVAPTPPISQAPSRLDQSEITQTIVPKTASPQSLPSSSMANISSPTTPTTPKTANTLTGVVHTSTNNPLENVIIEILDQSDTPIRATKTNKLGQFFSSTPLRNGVYSVSIEADGFHPSLLTLQARGDIIEPLYIELKQL